MDSALDQHGALAAALDADTILVNSRLRLLPAPQQELVLAHEYIHALQLAQPGNDPVTALEAEAWSEARALVEGRAVNVRGRGHGPLFALAVIDREAHPDADNWYGDSDAEPIGNQETVSVDAVEAVRRPSLEVILDKILAHPGTTDVIIVAHGTALGLSVRLVSGSEVRGRVEAINALGRDTASSVALDDETTLRMPAISEADAATTTMLTVARVRTLREKMNRVRGMNLSHVAFRACNMGNHDTLAAFKEFFRCRSVSAPDMRDTYGHIDPGNRESDMDHWARRQRDRGRHVFVEGAAGDQVGLATRGGEGHDTDYSIHFAHQSAQGLTDWMALHLRDGYTRGRIYYHGMFRTSAGSTEPRVLFIRDADFLSHLVRV